MIEVLREIAAAGVGRVSFSAPLAQHCSWRIGGPADLLVEPETAEQVARVICLAGGKKIPLVVIGQGTNLLFADAGIRGIVMKIGSRMAAIDIRESRITVAAGVWVPQLALASMRSGLSGLEHTIGIPGTLGGLVVMNGGSRRRGIGENVVGVDVVTNSGEMRRLTAADCAFSYRHSALQESGSVVTGVELDCHFADKVMIRREMLADLRERRRKFPRKQPNCGSVFLSTAEMHGSVGPPGKIIEDAGLKGVRRGQAEVSHQHANFIVNLGGATAADVLALIARIRGVVKQRIDFDLCCEVRYVGRSGVIVPAHCAADRCVEHLDDRDSTGRLC